MLLFSCFVSPSVATMHVGTHVIKPHVLHNTRFSLKQGEKKLINSFNGKAELLQEGILFGTQFPSLEIFIDKKVGF